MLARVVDLGCGRLIPICVLVTFRVPIARVPVSDSDALRGDVFLLSRFGARDPGPLVGDVFLLSTLCGRSGSVARRRTFLSLRRSVCAGSTFRSLEFPWPDRSGMGRMTHSHCHTPSLDSNTCSIIEPPPNRQIRRPRAGRRLLPRPQLTCPIPLPAVPLPAVPLLRVGWALVRSRRSTTSSPNSSPLWPNAVCRPIPLR